MKVEKGGSQLTEKGILALIIEASREREDGKWRKADEITLPQIYLGNCTEKAVCVPELQKCTFYGPRNILRIPVCVPQKLYAFHFASLKNFTHSTSHITKKMSYCGL